MHHIDFMFIKNGSQNQFRIIPYKLNSKKFSQKNVQHHFFGSPTTKGQILA